MLFVACARNSCSNMIIKPAPEAVLEVIRDKMKARLGILQQLPPWRLCGEANFCPDNAPADDAQPAYVTGRREELGIQATMDPPPPCLALGAWRRIVTRNLMWHDCLLLQ